MAIEKVNLQKFYLPAQNTNAQTQVAENNKNNDKHLGTSAKYMIGATCLAAVVVGIIGHNNNWWRKPAAAVKQGLENGHPPEEPNNILSIINKSIKSRKTKHGKIKFYTEEYENGNKLEIVRETYNSADKDTGMHSITTYRLRDNNNNVIYKIGYRKQQGKHYETILDLKTNTQYIKQKTDFFPYHEDISKIKLEKTSDGKLQKTDNPVQSCTQEEFDLVKRELLQNSMPKQRNFLIERFMNRLRIKVVSGTETVMKDPDGRQISIRDFGDNKEFYKQELPDGSFHLHLGIKNLAKKVYTHRTEKLGENFFEHEEVFTQNGTYYRKMIFFDDGNRCVRYDKDQYGKLVGVSEDEFEKNKQHAISQFLPEGTDLKL